MIASGIAWRHRSRCAPAGLPLLGHDDSFIPVAGPGEEHIAVSAIRVLRHGGGMAAGARMPPRHARPAGRVFGIVRA